MLTQYNKRFAHLHRQNTTLLITRTDNPPRGSEVAVSSRARVIRSRTMSSGTLGPEDPFGPLSPALSPDLVDYFQTVARKRKHSKNSLPHILYSARSYSYHVVQIKTITTIMIISHRRIPSKFIWLFHFNFVLRSVGIRRVCYPILYNIRNVGNVIRILCGNNQSFMFFGQKITKQK